MFIYRFVKSQNIVWKTKLALSSLTTTIPYAGYNSSINTAAEEGFLSFETILIAVPLSPGQSHSLPFAEGTGTGYYLFRTSAYAVILWSIYAVSFRRTLLVLVIALAGPATIHHLFLTPIDASIFSIINTVLSVVFDGLIVVIIFRKVFAHGHVNAETIYGALWI